MKQTDFVTNVIVLLGALTVVTIDWALAPINTGALLVGVKQWTSRLWLVVLAQCESRVESEESAMVVKETWTTL